MRISMCCGKGGVGKTTNSVALGICAAQEGKKTAIIDFDGGHSVARTLGNSTELPHNVLCAIGPQVPQLYLAVIEPADAVGIVEAKKQRWPLRTYLQQFPEDLGILPLVDMVNMFFGVPTDMATLEKFVRLTRMLHTLRDERFEYVVIDVEPTAGLERLLNNAEATTRSLRNLQNQGIASLLAIGVRWPDIAAYLKGSYIKKGDHYATRIEQTAQWLRSAAYIIVCTPERSPVDQAQDVATIVQRFGAQPMCYVVNNIRGEPGETEAINRLPAGLPIVRIPRQPALHLGASDPVAMLADMGHSLNRQLREW